METETNQENRQPVGETNNENTPATPVQTPVIERNFYALVTTGKGDKILLLPGEAGWKLPQWAGDRPRHPQEINSWIRQQVEQVTGLETIQLMNYYAKRHFNEQGQFTGFTRVLALELRNPLEAQLPQGAIWCGLAEAKSFEFENGLCQELSQEWLTEHTSGNLPLKRISWGKPGWFAEVEKWLAQIAAEQGWQISDKIEQRKANCISTILRVPTTQGTLYLKGIPHYFASEPNFSRVLINLMPDKLPRLLATDSERGLMLSADFGGTPVDKIKDLAVWKEALAEYARLQITCIPHAEELLAAGVRDRRLAIVDKQIEKLLTRREFMRVGLPLGLSAEVADNLQTLAPLVKDMCRELAEFGIPETIDSGDFHSYNVNQTETGFVFYDWSDLEITHPFISIFTFIELAWNYKEEVPDLYEQFREAYLAPWKELFPQVDLVEAFDLAYLLGALVQNLNYEWIWDNVEPREYWEFEYGIGEFYTTFWEALAKNAKWSGKIKAVSGTTK